MSQRVAALLAIIAIALAPTAWAAQSPYPGMGSVPVAGGVSFRVWAPHATALEVRGDFNGWSTANPLTSEGSNGMWSTVVAGAATGQQYKYYLTNAASTIPGTTTAYRRDPYSRVVQSTFGGSDANSVIYDPASYTWTGTGSYALPSKSQMVIYELHVGSFNAPTGTPATFDQAILRLDSIKQLGANVVEVMPPTEVPSVNGWGYDPVLPYSIEQDLGGPNAFKRFVEACHARSLGVLVDVVYNHSGTTLNDLYNFDLWTTSDGGGIYYFNDAATRDTPWGPRFDYSSPQVQAYLMGSVRMYLDEYRVDGFRLDATSFLRYASNGAVPGASSFLTSVTQTLAAEYPGKLAIAEDFNADQLASRPVASGGLGFDAEWDSFTDVAANFLAASDSARDLGALRAALQKTFSGDAFHRVAYVESHDTAAPEDLPNLPLPVRGGYLPRRLNQSDPATSLTTRRLSILGSMLALTAPGIPMVFMGQEVADSGVFSFPSPPAIDWSSLEAANPGVLQIHKDLIALRLNQGGNTSGLQGQSLTVIQQNDGAKVLAFLRQGAGGAGDDVVIIANFSATDFNAGYIIGVPRAGAWKVRFNSDLTTYDARYGTSPTEFTAAASEHVSRDSFSDRITIPRLRPYTAIILSQDAPPPARVDDWRALE